MRKARAAPALVLLFILPACHSRWPAKVLGDGIPISSKPIDGSIVQLRAMPRPSGIDDFNAPRVPAERNVYRVRAELLRFTLSDDGDIHLAIAQPGNRAATMIAEIPDPARMNGAPAKYRDEVGKTRADFIRVLGAPRLDRWQTVNRQVTVTGPIFFDALFGQVGGPAGGVSNGIEIHPVLRIDLNPRQGKMPR